MKNLILIGALTFLFASCTGSSEETTTESTDSTALTTVGDTAIVAVHDSMPADTVSVK